MFHSKATSSKLPKRGWKPRLEILEDRCVPATRTWDGGAISNNWTNAKNWVGDIAPVAGDDLIFPSTASDKTADNNFADGTLFNSITLGGGYTLRGHQIRLGVGGILSLGSSNIIKNDITLTGGSTVPRNIQVNQGATLFIDGVISGSHQLHKLGFGDLSFRANNTYTNVTDIKAGRLFIEKDDSLGSTSAGAPTVIRSGTKLFVNDQAIGTIRSGEHIIVEDGGGIQAINDVELSGLITTNGSTTLSHSGGELEKLRISGKIMGQGGIVILSNTGHVMFSGTDDNTYTGVTTVSGRLRLEKDAANAIPGALVINSTGSVRLDAQDQIADTATVTVIGDGFLLTNTFDETFHKLRLQGGGISGNKLRLTDFSPMIYIDILGRLLNNFPYIDQFIPERESKITLNELEATSLFSTKSAQMLDVSVILTSADGLIRVNNGPAETDLMIYSTIYSEGTPEPGDSRLTHEGLGKTLFQDYPADQYFVNSGELQISQFKRDLITPSFSGTDVTVKSGAKFTSDVLLGNLLVEAGGRVHPGPLTRPDLFTALMEQIISGTMGISGDLVLSPGSILEVTLNNGVAGVGHESFNVFGNVTLEGLLIEATMGPNALVGQNYRVIDKLSGGPINGFIAPPTGGLLTAAPTGQRLSFNHAGGFGNNDLVLTLQNTAPMAPGLTLSATEINEGSTVSVTGKLVDPDARDALQLFINWGDGSRQEIYRPGLKPFQYSHTYRRDGVYTARFEWLDQSGQGNSREFTVTVNNVAPALKLRTLRTTASGILLLSGWLSDEGDDRYTATLDFGDGTSRSKSLKRRDFFAVAHRYKNPGTYTLTLTLRDVQGAEKQYQREIVIS